MSNTVSFKVQINDSGSFKTVTADADELGKVIDGVKRKAKELNNTFINSASISQIAEGAVSALSQLRDVVGGLVGSYNAQLEAETKVAQAMRNTMGATDEEIQSIKDLCSAQQRLGVIGDEVQLAAAQELATYLEFSDSLKTIIPVMNDMAAQQLGIGASAESVTQIATMLGKVMNGQTEALSRYGYKFDDAQKYILKFGTEAERAAVLAEVVEQSVGGMNQALAQTSAGKLAHVKNELGDIDEAIGNVVKDIMPFLDVLAKIVIAAAGVTRLTAAIKSLGIVSAVSKAQALGLAAAEKLQAAAAKILGVSSLAAKAATGALKAEIIATEAAITLGLSLAISVLIEGLSRLISKSDDAGESLDDINSAEAEYKRAAAEARAETAADIVALEDLIKQKANEGEKVDELNRKYGEVFGTYSTAAEWYDALTSKSAEYCQQLAYEAIAAKYKEQLADALIKQAEAQEKVNALAESGKGYKTVVQGNGLWQGGAKKVRIDTPEMTEARQGLSDAKAEVGNLTSKMADATRQASELAKTILSGSTVAQQSWKEMSLDDLGKAIDLQEKKVKSLAGTSDKAAANEEAAILRQMKARKDLLEKSYGLENNSGKDKYDGSAFIKNATGYKEIANNIKYLNAELDKKDKTDVQGIASIQSQIKALEKEKKAIELVREEASRPAELNTLQDFDDEIKFQQSLRANASAEQLKAIDTEIARLKNLRTAFEQSSHVSKKKEEIKTFEELDAEIAFQTVMLNSSEESQRAGIQKTINALKNLRKEWDDALETMQRPAGVNVDGSFDQSKLNTIASLEEAISYLSNEQKKQAASEAASTQKSINALKEKRDMLESIASIPSMEKELSDMGSLSRNELILHINEIGIDAIKDKIKKLQKLLDDASAPLNAEQEKQVRNMISLWSGYAVTVQKGNLSFKEAWSNIKGIGNGILSLTEALKGDGDAWDKLCSIVDNLFVIFDGITGIIELIQTFVTLTNMATKAKEEEAVAAGIASAAEVSGAAEEITASTGVAVAKGAEATASTTAAVAGALSAHAAIPFIGIGLGLAAVAAILATMLSIPKFASGGLAYGPTLGLFGEYAGAGNNPEVVAPLDKLRSLIWKNGAEFGEVKFVIRGRQLEGILQKMNRISGRTE